MKIKLSFNSSCCSLFQADRERGELRQPTKKGYAGFASIAEHKTSDLASYIQLQAWQR